ncbi:MAG: dethiobiotin synthase [Desulfobulbaceae bacterium]|nr:dethiobiotin synthase [Desulfobulbaceae bacterium]
MPTFCICGIDTGIGKSIAVGLMARDLLYKGERVITQKIVQTGCVERSQDILIHRKLMEVGWLDVDEKKLTCPYCLSFPGSPHLAASLAGKSVDPAVITAAGERLRELYDWVLLEGAGGLLVPLTEEMTLLDYLVTLRWPLILVTSSRLGSINHTLMSLEVIRSRNLDLAGIVYNTYEKSPPEIVKDSCRVFSRALQSYGFEDRIVVLPRWPEHKNIDWQPIFSGYR